ncbi:MAG: allose kinase [bacterium]
MNNFVLGIDIGGTNLRLALTDRKFNIYNPVIRSLADIKTKDITDYILKTVYSYLQSVEQDILAIGIGVPGIVEQGKKIISCPNLPGLKGESLAREFKKKYKVPVFIEKDVNLLMMAEINNISSSYQNVVGVYIGTGVGCSIVINGKLYKGTRGFAGELGHIPFQKSKDSCNCGSNGCLELYTGGKKLQSIAENNDTDLENIFIASGLVKEEVEIYIENISRGVASVVNIIDPGLVILGGGVIENRYFPFQKLKKLIKKYSRVENSGFNLPIKKSSLEKFSGCKGASIYYHNFYQQKNS